LGFSLLANEEKSEKNNAKKEEDQALAARMAEALALSLSLFLSLQVLEGP